MAKEMGEENYRLVGPAFQWGELRDSHRWVAATPAQWEHARCYSPAHWEAAGRQQMPQWRVDTDFTDTVLGAQSPHPQRSSSAERDEDAPRPSACPLPPCLRTDRRALRGTGAPSGMLRLYLSDT